MSVLITGGLGHIGLSVCRSFVEHGKAVIITGRSSERLRYLEDVADRVRFVPADVVDTPSLYRLFVEARGDIEGVVHIAGLMGGPFFASNPRHHIYINTMGTVDMLEICRTFKVQRFIYISSGSVYGVRNGVPLESDPLMPGDLYGAAKASAEFFGVQYANEFGIDFRALRVYFAYGPGRYPHELYHLYKAIFGCLEGSTSANLPAGADQALDFTYVRDIAQAVYLLYEPWEVKYRQYNVCSGVYYKIPELISRVAKIAGAAVSICVGPGRIMPRGPSLDTARFQEEFGFRPEYSLERGVAEYMEWMKVGAAEPVR